MNKELCATVLLDGTVSKKRILELLDVSFEETKPKEKKPNERSKEKANGRSKTKLGKEKS